MAKEAVFTGVWARCPGHQNVVLEAGEEYCAECKITQRNLAMVPPFDVYCTENYWGDKFKKGSIYPVFMVVRDALDNYGRFISGYLFQNADKSLWEHVVEPKKFIPVKYLSKDQTDTWLPEK